MIINVHSIFADLFTLGSVAKLISGGDLHKLWSKVLGAEAKAKSEAKKLLAEGESAAKKLEADVKSHL